MILSYESSSNLTDKYSLECDSRIIWGGDKTVNTIKSKKTKIVIETYNPKVLMLFKDNDYSIFLLDDSSNYAFIPNTSKQLINSFGQKYREA